MRPEPRIRVSAILRWRGSRPAVPAREAGPRELAAARRRRAGGESLVEALQRELSEEIGIVGTARSCRSRARWRSSTRSRPSGACGRSTSCTSSSPASLDGSLDGRRLEGRGGARATGCSTRRAGRDHRSTRRSSGSCSAGGPATRACISARCWARVARARPHCAGAACRAVARAPRGDRVRLTLELVVERLERLRSAPVAWASAWASSQSASHGLRGSSGPWR